MNVLAKVKVFVQAVSMESIQYQHQLRNVMERRINYDFI
ncbi:hypothetical protein M918_08970 [Clostridium sp. BL8]|nr:hypothetical protein M918_08970 [Clostridium sp. BL8]